MALSLRFNEVLKGAGSIFLGSIPQLDENCKSARANPTPLEPGVADRGDEVGVNFALAIQAWLRPQCANHSLVNEIFSVRVISGKKQREPRPIREPIEPRDT
jgi:hypothetical protein